MMVRSLVDEVVRRRLWPVPLVALLVAIAAPLLFMKSSPQHAPAASEAPAAAAPGKLPVRAKSLLATSDKAVASRRRSGASQDPFAPPAAAVAAADAPAAAAAKPSAAAKSSSSAIPVVVTNSGGSKVSTPKVTKPATTRSRPTSPRTPRTPTTAITATPDKKQVTVDVRFGVRAGTKVRRRVAPLRSFKAGGKLVALFVKYSPKRRKAVFAIAPTTIVTGDVECRRKLGVCRYVDIPAGKHAVLTAIADDGSLVTSRLDVLRFHRAR